MNSCLRTKLHYFLTNNTSIQATSVLPLDEDGSFHLVHIDIEGERPPHAWRESVKRKMRKRVETFRNRWFNPNCWPDVESLGTSDRTQVAEALSPHTGKGFRRFFDDLIGYPRFVNAIYGGLVMGGIKFIGKLAPPPQKIPDKVCARFLKSGGDFEPAVDAFKDFVKKAGTLYRCPDSAFEVINRLGELVDWLKTCCETSASDLAVFEAHCAALLNAAQSMCVKVAGFAEPDPRHGATDSEELRILKKLDHESTSTRKDVAFVKQDVVDRRNRNSRKGKENRKGNDDNADHPSSMQSSKWAADLETALTRIRHKVVQEGMSVIAACRTVCLHFYTLPGKKDEMGRVPTAPLINQRGKEVRTETQFQTIARYYRARYNA